MICHSAFNASHTATKGHYPLISCLRHTYSANLPPGDFKNITQSKTIIQYKNTAERRGLRLSAAAFVFYKRILNERRGPQTLCDGRRGPQPILLNNIHISAAAFIPVEMSAAAFGQVLKF